MKFSPLIDYLILRGDKASLEFIIGYLYDNDIKYKYDESSRTPIFKNMNREEFINYFLNITTDLFFNFYDNNTFDFLPLIFKSYKIGEFDKIVYLSEKIREYKLSLILPK